MFLQTKSVLETNHAGILTITAFEKGKILVTEKKRSNPNFIFRNSEQSFIGFWPGRFEKDA